MKIEKVHNKIRYTLSNENLKVGDEVFPIANGRCLDDGGWILHNLDYREFVSGFPNEPHIIMDLNYDNGRQGKTYQVKTDKGYSPIERYFKIVKKEEKLKVEQSAQIGDFYRCAKIGDFYKWTQIENTIDDKK
jgi:ribosomal protein S17